MHGSPVNDPSSGRLMHVGTLFPSAKEDGEARGGVLLVRVSETPDAGNLELIASWTERGGGEYSERVNVEVPDETESYGHSGIRKAIALARYAAELQSWASDIQSRADAATGVDDWLLEDQRGRHERESVLLVVSNEYVERFQRLRSYLEAELAAVGDESMQQEVELLETLCQQASATRPEVRE